MKIHNWVVFLNVGLPMYVLECQILYIIRFSYLEKVKFKIFYLKMSLIKISDWKTVFYEDLKLKLFTTLSNAFHTRAGKRFFKNRKIGQSIWLKYLLEFFPLLDNCFHFTYSQKIKTTFFVPSKKFPLWKNYFYEIRSKFIIVFANYDFLELK